MLDTVKQHFYEGFRLSTEVRDKIQERWGTVYGAADEAQRSLEREFGADLQPAEEAMQRPVDVVHLADNVINLEARRDQQILREQTAQDRHLAEARNLVEGAYNEFSA